MSLRALAPSLASTLVVAGALGAQPRRASDSPTAPLPGRVVDVAAGEFFLQSPDTIGAGLTTFRLRQIGLVHRRAAAGGAAADSGTVGKGDATHGFHMLWIVKLDAGKSAADLYRAAQTREPTPWALNLGGPSFAMPPGTTNATLVLAPGNYVLACYVGSAREDRTRSHMLRGMFRALTVVATHVSTAPMPEPDVVMHISERGAIAISRPLRAGRRIIRVENAGTKPYEFVFRRVLPGRTVAEALTWRLSDVPATPRPFTPFGGLSDVPAGGSITTTMTFEPGDYVVGEATRVAFSVKPAP